MVTSACRSIEPHAELSLERTGDFGHLEDFELIVNLNVIVALETQTAFATGLNFAHIVLEVLQAGEFAGPDHHVVAQEASAGIAAYHAFENTAAGNEPNLGHADNLTDFQETQRRFLLLGRKHAAHGRADFINSIVDDVVVTNIHVFLFSKLAGLLISAHVKADNDGLGSGCQVDVGFRDAAHGAVHDLNAHFFRGKLRKCMHQCFC